MRKQLVTICTLASILAAASAWAAPRSDSVAAPLSSLGLASAGVPSAMGLKGLWALEVSADSGSMPTSDIRALYPNTALTVDDQVLAFGFSLRLHRHLHDAYYLGAGFDSLTKSFNLRDGQAGVNNLYDWIGLFPNALAGWTFYRGEQSFLSAEAQLGSIFLSRSTFSQEGGGASGSFEGSSLAWVASLNATWFVIPSVGLHLAAGLRQAKIENVAFTDDSSGATIATVDAIDFSGPMARLGISFFWGMDNPWGNMHETPAPPAPPPAATR